MTPGSGAGEPSPPRRVLDYGLTPADALAWVRLPREIRGWRYAVFLAPPVILGMTWAGAEGAATGTRIALAGLAAALAWGAAQAVLARADARAARALVATPQPVRLEIRADRLIESRGGVWRVVMDDRVRQVVCTQDYLFVDDGTPLIVPRHAFADAGQMQALAARITAADATP